MRRPDPQMLRVYVVTSGTVDPRRTHEDIVEAAIEGGATAVQLRAPELRDEELAALVPALADRCRRAGIPLVVNDRVDVAVASGASGAHVGQDEDAGTARARLGPDRVLGISVGTPDEAWTAERAGADYLGVTVWATDTKPDARPVGIDGLREVAAATALPVVGIGGIDAGNAAGVLEAGAAGIAVIGAVAAADDPVAAVRSLRDVVDRALGRTEVRR
ncbi:MAG TPA: thiamine phosphate synthase [Actinomycetota bacterium]|jgi:thiamine-phosphate pyrophosphorylase|nr:thiamine phosphate synthase [Actinomycetota bacterium]